MVIGDDDDDVRVHRWSDNEPIQGGDDDEAAAVDDDDDDDDDGDDHVCWGDNEPAQGSDEGNKPSYAGHLCDAAIL